MNKVKNIWGRKALRSAMRDMWGGAIFIDAEADAVGITFVEDSGLPWADPGNLSASMELDADQTRKLIKKLKKALYEMEDM